MKLPPFSQITFPLLFSSSLFGDTNFSGFRPLYTNNPTASIRSADLNSDGRPDLIINGSRLAELRLNSASGLTSPLTITDGFIESFGDLDGDGDLDAIATYRVGTSFNRRVSWLANDGSGNLSSVENLINNGIDATVMPPVDLDNDGDLDIIVGTFSKFLWMENIDGRGTFGPSQSILPDSFFRPSTGGFADLNNDDLPDLIATIDSGGNRSVVVHFQLAPEPDGTRNFSTATEIAPPPFTLEAIGDFNNDNQTDVLAININGPANFLYGVNDGTFTSGPTIPEAINQPSLTPVDWDGDGDTDLIGRDFSNGPGSYFLENDGGTFATSSEFSAITNGFENFLIDDFSGNDRADFLIIQEDDKLVSVEQTSLNTFASPLLLKQALGNLRTLQAASLDADGRPDFLMGNVSDVVSQVRSSGPRDFTTFEILATTSSDDFRSDFITGDFDGINNDDFIQRNSATGELRLFRNDGAGGFMSPTTIATQTGNSTTFATGDFNKDTRLDFLLATGSDFKIYLQNTTNQTFTATSLTGSFGSITALHVVDADGDTNLDIISGSLVGVDGEAHRFLNNGSGSFAPSTKLLDLDDAPSFTRLADLDGTGGLDLVVLDNSGIASNLDLFLASGTSFTAKTEIFAGSASSWTSNLGDLDNDGDLDLVMVGSAGFNHIRIYWFENEAGIFSAAQTISSLTDNKWSEVLIVDVDQDGDNDLVAGDSASGIVRWFENQLGEDPLTRWAKPQGIDPATPNNDSDGDGIPLFVEFAYNLDPNKPDHAIVPSNGLSGLPSLKIYPDGNRIRADYEYLRRVDANEVGLTYALKVSDTMAEGSWVEKSLRVFGTDLGNGYLRANQSGYSILTGSRDQYFGRFHVTYDPPVE
ncbi:VCBS repeat-containing protein [Verrucomicrobiaceae bacterium 227]